MPATIKPHVEIAICSKTWVASNRSAATARATELLRDEKVQAALYGDCKPPRAGEGQRVAVLTFVDGLGRRTAAGRIVA